ncbi:MULTISPECIES: SWIM zinc finger family protein [unclassified Arthrobacter]|uniref:SWIM zinc finger family protein n=1 Tax=unclassified Arthrobacter TaxID=235627 RepID=UPI0033996215
MTLTNPPQLADPVISSLVGGTSLSRGRTYSRKGAVSSVEWNPKKLELKGMVQGNRSAPYRTRAAFKNGVGGLRLEWGFCSCPMQFNCKHVAALLLEISSGPVMEQLALLEIPPAPKLSPPEARKTVQKPPAQKKTPPALWQEQIHSLLHPQPAAKVPRFRQRSRQVRKPAGSEARRATGTYRIHAQQAALAPAGTQRPLAKLIRPRHQPDRQTGEAECQGEVGGWPAALG